MYDQYLRQQNTTNRLQTDLRSTMKAYYSDKERLSHNLSTLHVVHRERSQTELSLNSSKDFSSSLSMKSSPRRSNYFRSPNFLAGSTNTSVSSDHTQKDSTNNSKEKKWKERKEPFNDKYKKEKDLLKLPVIHSARTKRTEWESGKFVQTSKQPDYENLEPLPGINAAKALLSETMKIPSIYDPQRTDTAFDTSKNKKVTKKVTFADENHGSLLSVSQIEPHIEEVQKQSAKKGNVPEIKFKANQFSHASRPKRPKRTSLLPPIKVSPFEEEHDPSRFTEGVNHWKSVYSTMINQEDKTRALTDILNALRMKKYDNEMSMKYGDEPRPKQPDYTINDFMSSTNKITAYRDEQGHTRRGIIPLSRCSSVSRLSTDHPNTAQLQNYLKQLSKSRRYLDHIDADKYSDTSASNMKTVQTSVPAQA